MDDYRDRIVDQDRRSKKKQKEQRECEERGGCWSGEIKTLTEARTGGRTEQYRKLVSTERRPGSLENPSRERSRKRKMDPGQGRRTSALKPK